MIICICHNVSDKKVQQVIQEKNVININQLKREVDLCNQCKRCACEINNLIKINKLKAENIIFDSQSSIIPIATAECISIE